MNDDMMMSTARTSEEKKSQDKITKVSHCLHIIYRLRQAMTTASIATPSSTPTSRPVTTATGKPAA